LMTRKPVVWPGVGVCAPAGSARRSSAIGTRTRPNKRREPLRGQLIVLFVLLSNLMDLIPTFRQPRNLQLP
jgi:hypothetical protein